MKRFLIVAALIVAGVSSSFAQSGFGVRAGMNFSSANVKDINNGSYTGLQIGVAYNLDLPLGFSVQPALQYNLKGANLGFESGLLNKEVTTETLSIGYLELMASLQWGLDLIVFRPFIDLSPFVGYAVNGSFADADLWSEDGLNFNRFEYGLGLGLGFDIWRFQLIGRYNWNFGSLSKAKDMHDAGLGVAEVYNTVKNANFGGFTLSLAYFF